MQFGNRLCVVGNEEMMEKVERLKIRENDRFGSLFSDMLHKKMQKRKKGKNEAEEWGEECGMKRRSRERGLETK